MSWIELVAQRHPQQLPEGVTPPANAADWYRIENSVENTDETDVYVYDSIGGWMGTTADDFVRDLKEVTTARINLRLNSPGGSVFEGITIANAIRSHSANVTVYVDGLAASIASVIALAGDRLVMLPQSQMMIHDASGGCYGNAAEMQKMAELLDKQSDNIADAYADRAGGTAAEWRDLMREETWYTAKEAVAAGLADEVMAPPKKAETTGVAARMQTVWDLTAYRYAGREKAPTPPMPVAKAMAPQFALQMSASAKDIETQMVEILRGAVRARNEAPAEPAPEDPLTALIRNAVREAISSELAPLLAALPPFLKPDEDEETEDATEEEPEAASDPDEVEDASEAEEVDDAAKKKLPPWLKPDEEEEDDTEDAAAEEPEASTDLGDPGGNAESQESVDNAFAGLIAHLKSPSPSADDIFNRLKEAL